MGETTKIEWCDHTFNPWWGCLTTRRMMSENHWRGPERWDRQAASDGVRRRVFCASMCDVFERNVQLDAARERLWALVESTPNLDWLLLTKRPENFASMLPFWSVSWPNVWLGISAEDQPRLLERAPHLSEAPAAQRFVSYEPALGPLQLGDFAADIDWLIAGAESGAGARPMREDWVRDVRDECTAAGVAFFYKQKLDGRRKVSLPMLDGRQWSESPQCHDSGYSRRSTP